ncbi:MAG TPA: N-acetylmuramidase domain-containing protein [Ignavibacteriales bacterium]|nr:N-acetylmuramidase domain-containing protein [Ignavibacteriales bacterium]
MNLKILKDFASLHSIDWRILYAILMTESNAEGFDEKGKIKQRFESGIFSGFTKVKNGDSPKHPALPGLDPKWIKQRDDHELLLMSYSYGIAQIMGWQYPYIGYRSIYDMVMDYEESEDNQVKNFCLFCQNYRDGRFLKALQELNYRLIANMYNGAAFERNRYDEKLKHFFNQAKL